MSTNLFIGFLVCKNNNQFENNKGVPENNKGLPTGWVSPKITRDSLREGCPRITIATLLLYFPLESYSDSSHPKNVRYKSDAIYLEPTYFLFPRHLTKPSYP